MVGWYAWVLAGMAAGPALAAGTDKLAFGTPPEWVAAAAPAPAGKDDGAAVRILSQDQQVRFERGRKTVFAESLIRLQTAQGLQAANIGFAWNPETDAPVVHHLLIRRGAQVIDVLKSQQFTVLRRESNLERAMLDGMLTATLQPEGLQVGDVLDFAYSITSDDPVLAGHVEQIAGGWAAAPMDAARLRAQWPADLPMQLRQLPGLPVARLARSGAHRTAEIAAENLQPFVPPNGAPARYRLARLVELTDYHRWDEVAALMAPLYAKASAIPATGPLADELARIKAASVDPKARAAAALALVQDRVRYLFLGLNQGNLVPADAATTWTRRFGDCKGKTALLLGLLHGLGIEAQPVLVSTAGGDGLDRHLPMVGLFDHVLVRATVAGRDYWLDGTRIGDRDLDRIRTPNFGWGLPVQPAGAALVRMLPAPLDRPEGEVAVTIDASGGVTLPAPMRVTAVLRGDAATATSLALANLAPELREKALRDRFREQFNFVEIATVAAAFDPAAGEERLTMTGTATLKWKDGWYETDGTGLAWQADFHRDPGPDADAPFANAYPFWAEASETIVVPPGFHLERAHPPAPIAQTIAGTEYKRTVTTVDNRFVVKASQRSLQPEFPASEAPAAQAALRKLADESVYLHRPSDYRVTEKELAAQLAASPTTAADWARRGSLLLDRNRNEEALAAFDRARSLDPKDADYIAGKGFVEAAAGKAEESRRDLDAAAAINPRSLPMLRGRAVLFVHNGDLPQAQRALEALLTQYSGDAWGNAMFDEVKAMQGGAEADAAARRAIERGTGNPQVYLRVINSLKREGRRDEALKMVATMSDKADPRQAYSHVVAAKSYAALDRPDEARREFDRALAIKPEPYIYVNRADTRPKSDVAGRRADIAAALKLDAKDRYALLSQAALLAETGDKAGAIAAYGNGLAIDPNDIASAARRGLLEAEIGRTDAADADFSTARRLAGDDPVKLNDLCWSKAIAGLALRSALADCDASLAKAPAVAATLDSRGLVHLRLGELDAAIADYDAALKIRPGQPASLYGRAVARARRGDLGAARDDLASAVSGDAEIVSTFTNYGVAPPAGLALPAQVANATGKS